MCHLMVRVFVRAAELFGKSNIDAECSPGGWITCSSLQATLSSYTHARSMSALYVWQAASKGWAVVESIRQRLSSRFSQVRTVKHTVGSRLLHRV